MAARWLFITALFWLLLLSSTSQAAFITDKIVVEIHAQRFGQGAVLKKLASGSSVEVLMSDGKYSRIRTTDNITGWIESKYLSNEQPIQLEYLELLSKSKTTEAKLQAAEKKLASVSQATAPVISTEELTKLKKQAKDAKWMRAEMNKARNRAKKVEAQLKSEGKQASASQTELDALRTQNKHLEQRLAAAILISEQQETQMAAAQQAATQEPASAASISNVDAHQDDSWAVNVEWFLGSILTAIIIGIVLGINWLDKRMRQRHGGFRLY